MAIINSTAISVRRLKIRHLRCHIHSDWQLNAGLNLWTGANGSGKTTVLEAVYMLVHGRSFRQAVDRFLVSQGKETFCLQGQWKRYGPMNIELCGKRGNTTLRLQGQILRRQKDISEGFPVIAEAPQGERVVDGVPRDRRRWLDHLLLVWRPGLRDHYHRYLRAVMQRSRLLRSHAQSIELESWEHQIVHHGLLIDAARRTLLDELNALLRDERELTGEPLVLALKSEEYRPDAWQNRLKAERVDDLRGGGLRFGPHRDQLEIRLQDADIRKRGSRGQQKLAMMALRMAECAIWQRYRGLVPVLLLDDCFEALDTHRQQCLLERLVVSPGQILMTAPEQPTGVRGTREMLVHKLESVASQRKGSDKMKIMGEAA